MILDAPPMHIPVVPQREEVNGAVRGTCATRSHSKSFLREKQFAYAPRTAPSYDDILIRQQYPKIAPSIRVLLRSGRRL
jgi:hypothetical protein